jgi:hypothetical protein
MQVHLSLIPATIHIYLHILIFVTYIKVTAYLYSWIKSSLPVDSYDCEFVVHGVVSYLVDFYAEQLFGEDSAKYR